MGRVEALGVAAVGALPPPSPPSQASYAVLAEESQAFFKLSQHTNSISNSAILRNSAILLSDLCACVHVKKIGVAKEAIVLQ